MSDDFLNALALQVHELEKAVNELEFSEGRLLARLERVERALENPDDRSSYAAQVWRAEAAEAKLAKVRAWADGHAQKFILAELQAILDEP